MTLPKPMDPVPSSLARPLPDNVLVGAVAVPPSCSWDGRRYTGSRVAGLDIEQARQVPGVVDVVVHEDFVAVLAIQHVQAELGVARLAVQWSTPETAVKTALPGTTHQSAGMAGGNPGPSVSHRYLWHPAEDTSPTRAWAVAHWRADSLTVWAPCDFSTELCAELAALCGVAPRDVTLVPTGERSAHGQDMAVDAALLSRHARRAVKVYAGHHDASFDLSVNVDSQAGRTVLQSNFHAYRRPSRAALLSGVDLIDPASGWISTLPGEAVHVVHATVPVPGDPEAGMLEAMSFAESSYWDEVCRERGEDPLRSRLAPIRDAAARELIEQVASHSEWDTALGKREDAYLGRGFAYARVLEDASGKPNTLMSAWVVDVSVDKQSGRVAIERLTVGHRGGAPDAGSSTPEIESSVRNAAQRLLAAPASFDTWPSAAPATTASLPAARVDIVAPPSGALDAPLAWSRAAALPAAAAIANAIYDATGIRMREAPFSKQALIVPSPAMRPFSRGKKILAGLAAATAGFLVAAWPWKPAIAPVDKIDTTIYSSAAIDQGRLIASVGNCASCHTTEGGQINAGGRALPTPFGTIYTTNITPDRETGIGGWSFAAFDRAMRRGIHRDGHQLYPAFPYTAFSKMSDTDMQALYAYLMTQPAVKAETPSNNLAFPFSVRPLLAGWNALFHHDADTRFTPQTEQSPLWNRGAYLVEAVGHCSACHSPRNALGVEQNDWGSYLSGAVVKGWEAPAINHLTHGPNEWSESDFYQYLRTGYSARHGAAAGPMAPVIQGLSILPDQDIRAMAHYLGTQPKPDDKPEAVAQRSGASAQEQHASTVDALSLRSGANLFNGACAACHSEKGGPALFGARPMLAVNTAVHSDNPDNLIRTILFGVREPADASLGYMPGFRDSLNDKQIADLVRYLRVEYASGKPGWTGLESRISALRDAPPD